MINAEILADSICNGSRLVSIKTIAPKFLDAEIEKHRMISSNSSSDRAIPMLRMVEQTPFLPPDIRLNEKGMQGYNNPSEKEISDFYDDIKTLHSMAVSFCKKHQHIHKQHLNRYFLPFSLQTKIMTANIEQFEYFIKLRASEHADPNIQILALKIKDALEKSVPKELTEHEWHLPFIDAHEYEYGILTALRMSVARCARISYNNFNGFRSTPEQDVDLAYKLQQQEHWSCFEHQAIPLVHEKDATHVDKKGRFWSGNFCNWIQYRQTVSGWN